jgi:formate dehydrogenase assembly factor FdhD
MSRPLKKINNFAAYLVADLLVAILGGRMTEVPVGSAVEMGVEVVVAVVAVVAAAVAGVERMKFLPRGQAVEMMLPLKNDQ